MCLLSFGAAEVSELLGWEAATWSADYLPGIYVRELLSGQADRFESAMMLEGVIEEIARFEKTQRSTTRGRCLHLETCTLIAHQRLVYTLVRWCRPGIIPALFTRRVIALLC